MKHVFGWIGKLFRRRRPAQGEVTTTVTNCARCGGVHEKLVFAVLKQPAGEDTHWAPCPATGEPILLQLIQEPADADGTRNPEPGTRRRPPRGFSNNHTTTPTGRH